MKEDRISRMRERLDREFAPESLEIQDDSHLHIGHEGAKSGLGHFTVRIVTSRFEGVSPLERHKMVYEALGSMMQTDIHALRVVASAPLSRSGART